MRPALAVRSGRRREGSGWPTDVDTLVSPSCVVEPVPLEDERGVDVAAIRALLSAVTGGAAGPHGCSRERDAGDPRSRPGCTFVKFDPVSLCRVLYEEHVDYVVIGGLASVILGSPLPTEDIDLLPDRSGENLERRIAPRTSELCPTWSP